MTAVPMTSNIATILDQICRERGGQTALSVFGRPEAALTFGDLYTQVNACAAGLNAIGVRRGDSVVVFVPMSVELYVLLIALFRIGAVAVFIDPWGGQKMIEAASKLMEPAAFIGVPTSYVLRARSETLRKIPRTVVVGGAARRRRDRVAMKAVQGLTSTLPWEDLIVQGMKSGETPAVEVSEEESALVTFTGGTTGHPKGANRTHGFLLAQHRVLLAHLDNLAEDVHFTNLPIVALHNLACGSHTVLAPPEWAQRPYPPYDGLHQLFADFGVTITALSPAPLSVLASDPTRRLPNLRHIFTGGGPVTNEDLERTIKLAPASDVTVLYGSTEAEPIAHAAAQDVIARDKQSRTGAGIFVGAPVAECAVRLIRITNGAISVEDGTELSDWDVVPGTPGEVIVSGSHVNREYIHDPKSTAMTKIRDEAGLVWHRTGDVARIDSDGNLWLLGRIGSGFRMDGATVFPFEIEIPVSGIPEAHRAAVVTVRFEGSGREFKNAAAVLAVEAEEGHSRAAARDAAISCLQSLGYSSLIEVRTVKRIPMDKRHGAKVDVERLRTILRPDTNPDSY